jgi:type II restriction/modification system DNA methylase subunit YeeA
MVLAGANVHVSMVGFDDGTEASRIVDGRAVSEITSSLTGDLDHASGAPLQRNVGIAFIGTTKGGDFDISEEEALSLLQSSGNPNRLPNSDVLKPIVNGRDILNRHPQRWLIDNADRALGAASMYERPHGIVVERVKPSRDKNRDKWLKENWWKLQRMRPEMRAALVGLSRFIATPRVSKHRVFAWFEWPLITDDQTVVFARSDEYFFGVMHSRLHEVWARAQGTQVRERQSGFRYTPTTCFETCAFPRPTNEQEGAIATAALELDTLRNNWLNPPEWMREEVLEFPGSVDGSWARYVRNPDGRGVGTVRYPRLVPKNEECAKELKKRTLTNLYNQKPTWLTLAHKRLDEAVFAAYGWPADLTDEQILEKLLALNLERAKQEAAEAPRAGRAKRSTARP